MNKDNTKNNKSSDEVKLSYIGQFNGLAEYILHNQDLTVNERVLYMAILFSWNAKKRPDVLEVTTQELLTYSGLCRDAFFTTIKKLAKRGFFTSYTPATRKRGNIIELANLKTAHKTGFMSLIPLDPKASKAKAKANNIPSEIPTENNKVPSEIPTENNKVPSEIQTDNNKVPSEIPTENNKVPSEIPTENKDSVGNSVGSSVGSSVGNPDGKLDSSINKNKSKRVKEFSFFPSESEKFSDQNSKNKEEEEEKFLSEYQKQFIGEIRKKWNSSMQLKFPKNDPVKVAKVNSQIVNYCEQYSPEVVQEAFDYCINHPWLSGKQPDRNGKLFDTQLEWMLRPEIFSKMVNKEFFIRRTAQDESQDQDQSEHLPVRCENPSGAYPNREKQYDENLQDDYDWFYGNDNDDFDPDYPDKEYGSDSDSIPPMEGPVPPLDREDPVYYDEYGWIDWKGNEISEEEAMEYFAEKEKSAESGALSAIPSYDTDTSDIKF